MLSRATSGRGGAGDPMQYLIELAILLASICALRAVR